VSHKNEQAAKLFNSEVTELTVARRLSLSGPIRPSIADFEFRRQSRSYGSSWTRKSAAFTVWIAATCF